MTQEEARKISEENSPENRFKKTVFSRIRQDAEKGHYDCIISQQQCYEDRHYRVEKEVYLEVLKSLSYLGYKVGELKTAKQEYFRYGELRDFDYYTCKVSW